MLNNYQRLYASIFSQTQQILESNAQKLVLGETTDITYGDARTASLSQFLAYYQSPLEPYSEKIVMLADQYGFHYGLLPAIAMVESGLCRKIPENSYNCWGWGIYGNKVTRFESYDEAIDTISRGIKKYYIDKGLTTPEDIMRKYTPPSNGSWAHGVNTFLKIIE